MAADGYAGDKMPKEAWDILERDPGACLIDVRTEAEWRYVGLPKLEFVGQADALRLLADISGQ